MVGTDGMEKTTMNSGMAVAIAMITTGMEIANVKVPKMGGSTKSFLSMLNICPRKMLLIFE